MAALSRGPAGRERRRSLARLVVLGLAFAGALLLQPGRARAGLDDVILEHTRPGTLRPGASSEVDPELYVLMQRVDTLLQEAVQDLGLTLDLAERPEPAMTESALIERAAESWVIAAELERARNDFVLRIVLVPPGSQVLYVRTQSLSADELPMRVVLMTRDLVEAGRGRSRPASSAPPPSEPAQLGAPPQSEGRAILALNAALLGGYAGYSLQQASGSEDDRLTYPLAALGAGVGLGGAMLVAEEWDIGVGDAWFLSAGVWWPTLSGFLLSESYGVADEDRYAYGLLGATAGLTLTTTLLSFRHVTDGGAALAHSGGAFGTLLGALTELAIDGSTSETPRRGMGFGAGGGLVLATALLTRVEPSASRVLLIDLAASLGALTGAAAASPLLLVDEDRVDSKRNRLWLASVAAGTVAGGVVGYFSTRSRAASARALPVLPSLAVLEGPGGPAFGPALGGVW